MEKDMDASKKPVYNTFTGNLKRRAASVCAGLPAVIRYAQDERTNAESVP
jgi:hypothetical protein